MSDRFAPHHGPILVRGEVSGPAGVANVLLVMDTGATPSLIRATILTTLGYDPDASPDRIQVAMGNGVELVPRVAVNRLTALGSHRIGVPVLSHPLPAEVGVDGLLGLDFFRGHVLTIDFAAGAITLL